MRRKTARYALLGLLAACAVTFGGEVAFTKLPTAVKAGTGVKITFAVSKKTDVEVAVLDAKGKVVRHLAAGVLGGEKAPPAPLKAGLSQTIAWDGQDDFGKPAEGGPFQIRVRAGIKAKFGRFIGGDPYNFGAVDSIACDEDGNLYVLGFGGEANQGQMVLRVFDPQGRYVREILPFPADLPPGSMKEIAKWDAGGKRWRPRNLKSLNPDFYDTRGVKWGGHLTLVAASRKNGVLLTDGGRLEAITPRGAVAKERFAALNFWTRKYHLKNSGGGPTFVTPSPDGKWLYLAGPYASKTRYGHKFIPAFPPGRIYRMKLEGGGSMQPFVTIPVAHKEGQGGAWLKAIKAPQHFTVAKGPVHQVAVDAKGNVYVCDRERGRISVYDESGKESGYIPIAHPGLVAVHPKTGAVYALDYDCVGYHKFKKVLMKFEKVSPDAKPVAVHDFGLAGSWPSMALSAGQEKTIIWVAGVKGGLLAVEDKGKALEVIETQFKPKAERQPDWNRLAVDYERDEVYASNGTTRMWRYDGKTGQGALLKKNGKPFYLNDLSVGYDGLLYARVSNKQIGGSSIYSGPFWRLDRELNPAPFPGTGTHVLSPYIYSRYGVGFAERGIGVGPKGECYLSFMYRWVAYAIGGFGPDGKPLPGKYLKGKFPAPPKQRKAYPPGWDTAVIGPIPQANGGIRVDLKGNIYVGMLYWPKNVPLPPGASPKDRSWTFVVGSVVKFDPKQGGFMPGKEGQQSTAAIEGAKQVYPGLAPFSRSGFGGNTCCVCRVPRFDLDRYGRLCFTNAVTNSVAVVDNAGNLIAEIGRYGNFDSQYVPPDAKAKKPVVAVPEIPLTWPTSAGFSEDHLYINDTYSRRVVRVDFTYASEKTCPAR